MIPPEEERAILPGPAGPKPSLGLMDRISDGEPFLLQDSLGLARDNWVILVGYPLAGAF